MNMKKLLFVCLAAGAVARADVPTYSNAQEALYDAIKSLDLNLIKISLTSLEQANEFRDEKDKKYVPIVGCLNALDEALIAHKWYKKWGWRLTAATGLFDCAAGLLIGAAGSYMVLGGSQAVHDPAAENQGTAGQYINGVEKAFCYTGLGLMGFALLYRTIAYHRLNNRIRRVLNMLKKSSAVSDGGEQALAEFVLARVQRKL